MVEDLLVVGEVFDSGDNESGAGDGFGIGFFVDVYGGGVDGFGGGGKVAFDLFEKGERKLEAHHEEGCAFGLKEEVD